MLKNKKLIIILLLVLINTQLLASSSFSYKDVKSQIFDKPSASFQACFEQNFNKIKNDKNKREKFFISLKSICNNQTINDKKYIVKACIVNGYLEELKLANKKHNIEDTIDYAQAQIINDCYNYLLEVAPTLNTVEKKELNNIIIKATSMAKQTGWIN